VGRGGGLYRAGEGVQSGWAVTMANGRAGWWRWPMPGLGVMSWAVGGVT
jgi:hypothetical protein